MSNRKLIYPILILLLILAAIIFSIVFFVRKDYLNIYFLNVGQGDSILVSQGSNQLLIDGGKDGKLMLQKLGKYIPFWDRKIEIVVSTHPDQDHIGGLVDVFKAYNIGTVIKTNAKSDSEVYKKLEEEIAAENAQAVEAKKDVSIKFANGAIADILFPINSIPEAVDDASNGNSVVIKLTYGENSFLLTGDLPDAQETNLTRDALAKNSLNSQILKVSHHGSKYASSDEFLAAVKPADAIISVGKNSYGHPNQETLDRLIKKGIKIFRTDEIGDIIYQCQNLNDKCQMQSL
ncbi:MAG TPA: MBL fold metallo-hydrolase [Candidatus Moranbacteria bacterium]|nr:MBL fold metallo-hydrolase [Candidatus Moranbacteria bacterium]HSA08637.1 MBL fold metallo-hydrolase [Candidatus Moranbacteria bacterium]